MVKQRIVLTALGIAVSVLFAAGNPVFAQDAQKQQTDTKQPDQTPVKDTKPTSNVQFSFAGSFVELAAAHRERNEIASAANDAPFSTLPFSNSSLYGEQETRMSAQQSRVALKFNGDMDANQHLKAYVESDFLGAAVTANGRETNSYNFRMRQYWMTYDNDSAHFHLMAGQGWTMLTQNKVGIQPLQENAPLTINGQFVAGFNWARQPQIRIVEDINKVLWLGLSVEASQTGISGAPSLGITSSTGTATAPANGIWPGTSSYWLPGYSYIVNTANMCNSAGAQNGTTYCSNDTRPDVIEKIALDPGWGHFEVFGLQRWFSDQVSLVSTGSVFPAAWKTETTFGYGAGGSVLLPLIPKILDFQASGMVGRGLGRYGSSQLADVVVGADNGKLAPLPTRQTLIGLVVHPWAGFDIYAYGGQEEVSARYVGNSGGYGNPYLSNDGCKYSNPVGGATSGNTPMAGTTCTGNVKRVRDVTVGFWNNIYKGEAGRWAFGAQYEYVTNEAFSTNYLLPNSAGVPLGVAYLATWNGRGTPNAGLKTNNQVVFLSVRYYPY